MNAESQFVEAVTAFGGEPGVELPRPGATGFGSGTLRVGGKIAAMLVDGSLVVKLAGDRVSELIASGVGEPYDGGKERPMREWVAIGSRSEISWDEAIREAIEFARGR